MEDFVHRGLLNRYIHIGYQICPAYPNRFAYFTYTYNVITSRINMHYFTFKSCIYKAIINAKEVEHHTIHHFCRHKSCSATVRDSALIAFVDYLIKNANNTNLIMFRLPHRNCQISQISLFGKLVSDRYLALHHQCILKLIY